MATELSAVLGQEEDVDMDTLAYPPTETQSVEHEGSKEEEGESGSDDDDDDDEEDEEEDDAENEAEEIARRLTAQLWADIKEAQAAAAAPPRPPEVAAPVQIPQPIIADTKATSKEAAAISTVKTVLLFAATDPLVQSTLATTVVPGFESSNVLEMLQNIVQAGTISKEVARPLSQVVVSLARSELLFSPLPVVNTNVQPQKRKRDEYDNVTSRPPKRSAHSERDLQEQLSEAINAITHTLNMHSEEPNLHPSVVASIQQQLHQVFLFAVTSSAVGGQNMTLLQEISGLIQVLGVLSGIQIVQPSLSSENDGKRSHSAYNLDHNRSHTDIETAVYPCLISGCNKTFSRLYNLRTHQRVHASHRPFKCSTCPASFARNHDLKRHERGHERVVYKCLGCMKIFSRRDAIKRHKSSISAKARREDELGNMATNEYLQDELSCVDAAIEEVELDQEDKNVHTVKEGHRQRKQRLWNGTVTGGGPGSDDVLEEGELPNSALEIAQGAVIGLHGLLQKHVVKALGGDVSNVQTSSDDQNQDAIPVQAAQPAEGAADAPMDADASLASLIARITDVANVTRVSTPDANTTEGSPMNVDEPTQPPESQSTQAASSTLSAATQTFTRYGLNADQTFLLEQAIANATAAAQAQAEAEALLEEDEEDDEEDDENDDDGDGAEEADGGNEGGTAVAVGDS
jgi:hypothetical protein